jgi:hypothetical protein
MNTDVEVMLREGMERLTADVRVPAGLIPGIVRRRRRRRLVMRSAFGAAATAGALALVLAVVVVPARLNGSSESAVLAADVVTRANSALSAADPGEMAQMTITTRGAQTLGGATATITAEEWSYGDQWRTLVDSPAGHPLYDEGSSSSSVYTLVNYQTRTLTRQPGLGRPAPSLFGQPGAGSCQPVFAALPLLFRFGLPGFGSIASSLPGTVARDLRAAISCGTLTVAGRQRVDGVEAIELTSRPGSPISETIWVSPGTYLPVRVVVRSAFGAPAVQQTADITWLSPTAQNLAKLAVPIPAGFRQVPFLRAITPILSRIPSVPLPRFAALPAPALSAAPFSRSPSPCPSGSLPSLGGAC